MEQIEIPEFAIAAFERIHDLRVTVHDLLGTLWPFLPADRFVHTHPVCMAVKAHGYLPACIQFDNIELQSKFGDWPGGRIHVCHAGLLEWAVPVYAGGRLMWALFAGARRPAPGFVPDVRAKRVSLPATMAPPVLQPVGADEAALVLEHLRQLAARLLSWSNEFEAQRPVVGQAGPLATRRTPPEEIALRRTVIQRYVQVHHGEVVSLRDLAREMGLSPGRTSHVVRESCGASFRELLTEARLRSAMGLLRHSSLPIAEVALRCGFQEAAHFHRLFRREVGSTPHRYRRSAGS